MKKKTAIILGTVVAAAAIAAAAITIPPLLNQSTKTTTYHYDDKPVKLELGAASQKTLYSDDEFIQAMKPYTVLSAGMEQATAIPGLQGAWSLKNNQDATAKRDFVKVDSFDPQGIAVGDKNIFISAYDHSHKANSVIFVIDKQTGSYKKTIVLQHQDHAGGIAYDSDRQLLWVAGHKKSFATVYAIDMAAINAYDIKSQVPIAYHASFNLTTTTNTSTVSYFGNSLWVGFFRVKGQGNVQQFKIGQNVAGRLTLGQQSDASTNPEDVVANRLISGINQLQGIAPTNDAVLMTSSFGSDDSKLVRYDRATDDTLTNGQYVIMPPYLESVAWDGDTDRFYALFESATPAYRKRTNAVVDRILFVDSANFLSKSKPYDALRTPASSPFIQSDTPAGGNE
jgi:hypothetical protein